MGLPQLREATGLQNGLEAGTAQPVDRHSGNLHGQSSEQCGHACDIAVVLPGLIDVAVDHVIESGPVHRGIAVHECAYRNGCEIIGPHAGQLAAVAPEGRAHRIADVGFGHGDVFPDQTPTILHEEDSATRFGGPHPCPLPG